MKTVKKKPDMVAGNLHISEDSGYCAFPVGGDTYRGCPYRCLYCYEIQTRNQHLRAVGVTATPRDYQQLFNAIFESPEVRRWVIDFKIAITLGDLSDPFPTIEPREKNTLKFLRLLQKSGIGVLITTKAPHLITDEYLEIMHKLPGCVVKSSFSDFDEEAARILEPGAVEPMNRIAHLERIKKAGIPTVARIAPFMPRTEYDLKLLQGAVDGITIELFRTSTTWRHSIPVKFWEFYARKLGITPYKAPEGDGKSGSRRYDWIVRVEKAMFQDWQSEGMPYHSAGYHWILVDSYIMRGIYQDYRRRASELGMSFGICNPQQGIHNIDLNQSPYCCFVCERIKYDKNNLVALWHKNQWKELMVAPIQEIGLNMAFNRFRYANTPSWRPIALDTEEKRASQEERFYINDES